MLSWTFPIGCLWPILLKKSTMVSAAEKYASEIEIFTFGRGFRLGFHVAVCEKGVLTSQ
jgi:hypothetical protein